MDKNNHRQLSYQGRCLRTQTGKMLFGPAGDRLAVDVLERTPGFVGTVDFIHKMNITELFTVADDYGIDYSQAEAVWYPDRLILSLADGEIRFREVKTVTASDLAVSAMRWENHSNRAICFSLSVAPKGFGVSRDEESGQFFAESPVLRFDIRVGIAVCWSYRTEKVLLRPGENIEILAAAAVGNLKTETEEQIEEKLDRLFAFKEAPFALLEKLAGENNVFYSQAPDFICDDQLMNACWQYRWYILRNSMSRPRYGSFQETVMYEGRDHRMKKTPLEISGWEFSKMIPLSAPLQVNDLRWHPDRELTKEIIRSAFAGQDEDGLLLCTWVEGANKSYANYMIWAIWLFYLVDGDKEFIRCLLPSILKYIEGHEKKYQESDDGLLTERVHAMTGKEYQPSYWYFHHFPQNPKDPATFTPLKRVDRSVYHYLNLEGAAYLLEAVGEDGSKYAKKAAALCKSINEKMWDSRTGFYYDLHYETDEKAMVRNIVGIYPYWAQMVDDDHAEGILPLMDPKAFDTGSAFPSVSRDCPVFSPSGGWNGNFIKGRNGCIWCGPSWPYTTGIALEALGNESRRNAHVYDEAFDKFLRQYTIQHFRDGDYRKPYLVEHYDSVTGERLSDEADYNHSFWIDLIVTYVAGLTVQKDRIEVEPLKTHLKWFQLKGIVVRGHSIDIVLCDAGNVRDSQQITVIVDGKEVGRVPLGEKLTIAI